MRTYWAQIDSEGQVVNVTVWNDDLGEEEMEAMLAETRGGIWKMCDRLTDGGVRYESDLETVAEDQSLALRYNFPAKGFSYDADADAFIPHKPEDVECFLDTNTYQWVIVEEPASENL